jgi:ABC-2 type transport system permease protein
VTDVTERTSEPPRLRARQRALELWHSREILWNLVRKELKVKYTASVLGAVWSLLNPVVFLAVFTFVTTVLKGSLPNYPAFLLSGLLAWNLFSVSLSNGAQSVIANANLVKKVYFPREILPLATVGVGLVDFLLQSVVFLLFLLVFGYGFQADIWLYPFAFVDLLLFSVALTMFVSSLNVRYRDVQHLIGLALLVWFWLTPIVYPIGKVYDYLVVQSTNPLGKTAWYVYLANPMTWVVNGFQKALFHPSDPNVTPPPLAPFTAGQLGIALSVGAVVLLVLVYMAWRLYFSMSGDFAEEL